MKISKYIVLAVAVLLNGCSLLSPVTPPTERNYVINTLPSNKHLSSTTGSTILILTPETKPYFDGTQMVYINKPYQLDTYSLNNWAERPSQMLHPLIVESLQNSHFYRAVLTPPYSGMSTYALSTQILVLQQNLMRQPNVLELVVRAQLVNVTTNRLVASKQFNISQPMSASTPYAGVVAANQATARLLDQLTEFCIINSR